METGKRLFPLDPTTMSGPLHTPSMSAGSHEMRDQYSNQDPPRSIPHTAPSITPYLGLRARLSQVWMNRWTLLLLLVLVRLLFFISGLNHNVASARREALSACSDVETMGSAMASMPHYMSSGINELTATGIEKSVNGLMSMSTLSVTAVEEIVVFVIGMMTNTYLCLLTFAVTGSLQSVIKVIDSSQDEINKLGSKVGGEIGDTMTKFGDAYSKVQKALDGGVIGLGSISIPKLPDLNAQVNEVKGFKLPTSFDADLQKLNNSLPTFDQVKNVTEGAIRLPFEEVKKLINQNLGRYEFDRSVFPVPAKEQLSFCSDSDGINDFFDKLDKIASTAQTIFIAVLVVGAVLAIIPMTLRELRRWRHQKERSRLVNAGALDPLDTVYLVSRPYTSSFGLRTARVAPEPEAIKTASRRQNMVRWIVAYATTETALFVLCLAIAGLFSCLCQYVLLRSIQRETPALANQVGVFTDKVMASLNNASEQWAIETNRAITNTSNTINDDMLGWVGIATDAVNDTLTTFVAETEKVIDKAFGKTPLEDPIKEVINCLVLLKVQGIQKALTWVHDHAHIDFPTLPIDTFSVGALASLSDDSKDQSFLSDPGDKASDKITSAIVRVVNFFESGVRLEAIIAAFVLLVFVVNAIIGAIYAVTRVPRHSKNRGDGGAVLQDDFVAAQDFRSDNQDRFAHDVPLGHVNNTRQFEPAPDYTEAVKHRTLDSSISGRESVYQDPKFEIADEQRYPTYPSRDEKHRDYT